MNAAFTVFVKEFRSVGFWDELGLSTIGDRKSLVWRETWFDWTGMLEFDEEVFDVAWHTDVTAMSRIVPFDVNTRKFISGHVELDPVELLENI